MQKIDFKTGLGKNNFGWETEKLYDVRQMKYNN
jgi:hypothetical protein